MIKAVIFDVDGTLLDSERIYMRAWKEVGVSFGYDVTEQALKETRAVSTAVAKEIFRRYCGQDFPYEQMHAQRVEVAERIFAEKTPEQLRMLACISVLQWIRQKGIPMAVASSTPYRITCSHLEHAELTPYFDAIVGGDMVTKGKPNPEIFLKAAELLGVEPCHCLVVGDTPADVFAATAAGIPVILIPDQVPANPETTAKSMRVLSSLEQVPQVLETLI